MHKYSFEDAMPIIRHLTQNGYQAFLVGGCVRDLLLGRPIGDIDIATSAKPEQVQRLFRKVIPVGVEHGTVIVRNEGESYEVTTFRADGTYSDMRHPDQVTFLNTIEDDLKRRDFTMNALAMDQRGSVIDPFGGKRDLRAKRICTVGNASERFTEDPLRMIRALRFASQLGFIIDTSTLQSMIQEQSSIRNLATERITVEMTKLFAGNYVCKAVGYLRTTRIDRHLPVMSEHPGLINMLPDAVRPLHTFAEVIALLHLLKPAITIDTWAKRWKLANKQKREAKLLVEVWECYQESGLDPWLLYRLDKELIPAFIRLGENLTERFSLSQTYVQQEKDRMPIASLQDLDINGNDLMDLFPERRKGAWIKHYLLVLEQKVVFGELVNDEKKLKEWIIWNPPVTD